MIREVNGIKPAVHETAYIDEMALVSGNVECKANSSVWPFASIRGDMNSIVIGEYSNIQDNSSVHTALDNCVVIGRNVTVGHNVVLHGCIIGNNSLIGMGAIVLDGAVIGNNCLIGAGALIPPGKNIPDNSMVVGMPGKIIRELSFDEIEKIKQNSKDYIELVKINRNTAKTL